MLRRGNSTVILLFVGALLFLPPSRAFASPRGLGVGAQICDPAADFYLGSENYAQAIQHHLFVVQHDPENALAYYHLGFAYGMIGDHQQELSDYQKAAGLGLSNWDLFLNMGLLYLEAGRLDSANQALQLAELLAPHRAETHFDLGLLDERLGMYQKAEQELLLSLRIDPNQKDARNTLAVIDAEQGNYERAHREWSDLVKTHPGYTAARTNLTILNRIECSENAGATALSSACANRR